MGKKFLRKLLICSRHFQPKYLLTPIYANQKLIRVHLMKSAFPTENLPKSSIETTNIGDMNRENRLKIRSAAKATCSNDEDKIQDSLEETVSIPISSEFSDVVVQCMPEISEKATQVKLKGFDSFTMEHR
jgi:hypothetical protein